MIVGRTFTEILDEMVEAGELTAEEAAEEWRESHADDERNER